MTNYLVVQERKSEEVSRVRGLKEEVTQMWYSGQIQMEEVYA